MALALFTAGWWLYIDVPRTPQAVVACVIVYNAAFGYRYVATPGVQVPVFIII
jgi:hypothetical protein